MLSRKRVMLDEQVEVVLRVCTGRGGMSAAEIGVFDAEDEIGLKEGHEVYKGRSYDVKTEVCLCGCWKGRVLVAGGERTC